MDEMQLCHLCWYNWVCWSCFFSSNAWLRLCYCWAYWQTRQSSDVPTRAIQRGNSTTTSAHKRIHHNRTASSWPGAKNSHKEHRQKPFCRLKTRIKEKQIRAQMTSKPKQISRRRNNKRGIPPEWSPCEALASIKSSVTRGLAALTNWFTYPHTMLG